MVQGEGDQLDQDLEENQSEKNVKYRDLRKREEAMDQVKRIKNSKNKSKFEKKVPVRKLLIVQPI